MRLVSNRLFITAAAAACLGLLLALPALAGSSHTATANVGQTVTVTITSKNEFHFTLVPKKVRRGLVTFKIVNNGNLPHDFKVCASNKGGVANSCTGRGTKLINPTTTGKLVQTFVRAGKYEYLCTVSGHAAAGMKGILVVS